MSVVPASRNGAATVSCHANLLQRGLSLAPQMRCGVRMACTRACAAVMVGIWSTPSSRTGFTGGCRLSTARAVVLWMAKMIRRVRGVDQLVQRVKRE